MSAERVGSFFWTAVGLISVYGSFQVGLGTLREPGPGLLTFLAGCFISIIAVIDIVKSFFQKKEWAKLSTLWAELNWHRSLIVLLITTGFILLLERLGFFLSGFLVMFSLFKWVERLSWGKAIMFPAVTLGLTYLLFDVLLKLNLPRGILGF
jgi:putative tricarboxylic transport membrane protein